MGDTRCGSPGTLQGLVSSDPSTTKHKPFPCTATNLPVTAHTSPMLRHPSHMHLVGQEQSLHACMRTRHIMSGLHTMRATTHTHTRAVCRSQAACLCDPHHPLPPPPVPLLPLHCNDDDEHHTPHHRCSLCSSASTLRATLPARSRLMSRSSTHGSLVRPS